MADIRTIFVLPETCPDINSTSDLMVNAYDICLQNNLNITIINEANIESIDFKQTDVVIFDKFEGKTYDNLKTKNCARIVGPLCISVCLSEGKPIPNFVWPILNVALIDCVVCCSVLPKSKKKEIKEKVHLMGGCFKDNLSSINTHLITGSVKSEKYVQAAQSGVKIYTPEWIEDVWKLSQDMPLHGDDPQFEKHKCLPFYNLTISITGIVDAQQRSDIQNKISRNGGIFTNNMDVRRTDVLVVGVNNGTMSAKYKAARKNKLTCVTVNWIDDSIEKGYALPEADYVIRKFTSTPTKCDETNPNFSTISAIAGNDNFLNVEDTMINARSNKISPLKRKGTSSDLERLIDGLDVKKAKKSGQYLDGCSVFLAGFTPDQRDKLCKILNWSGATRYDDVTDRITHIIIGDTSCPEAKILKAKNYSSCLVSVQWLLDSMDKQQPVDEENYLINLNDSFKEQFSSPLGRKGLNLLRSNHTMMSTNLNPVVPDINPAQCEDNFILSQYSQTSAKGEDSDTLAQLLNNIDSNFDKSQENKLQKSQNTQNETEISQNQSETISGDLFENKTFSLRKFTPEENDNLIELIQTAGGKILPKTFKGIPDYIVTPICINEPIQDSALDIINQLWVLESLDTSELCEMLYYHRPMIVTDSKPLEKCVITISNYISFEREYLKSLIENLGGICQDKFSRVLHATNNIYPATHLICSEPEGKKYTAALKWGLPVVYKDWLIECATNGKISKEDNYLVGDAKAQNRFIKDFDNSKQVLTPISNKQVLNDSTPSQKTPIHSNNSIKKNNKILDKVKENARESPQSCSQVTPVSKIIEEARRNNLLDTPETPMPTKTCIDTPESPYGMLISPNLTASEKKQIKRYVDLIPYKPVPPFERKSTPLSVVKRRCLNALLGLDVKSGDLNQTPTSSKEREEDGATDKLASCAQNLFLSNKIEELEQAVKMSSEKKRLSTVPGNFIAPTKLFDGLNERHLTQESQPNTVDWDYGYDKQQNDVKKSQTRIFMISGVENDIRQTIVEKVESLGGQVSDLTTSDPKCTHLICPKPARNEKTLACIAAGKYILHISYIDKCVEAGEFLDEDDFEFGNPRFYQTIHIKWDKETENRMESIYWWRKEIARRGYGAFNDMRAMVVAQKREMIVRVIEAGGGIVYDIKPPFDDSIFLTHCLLEPRSVVDYSVYNELAKKGILCLNTLYISEFLFRTTSDVRDLILPNFSQFYSKS